MSLCFSLYFNIDTGNGYLNHDVFEISITHNLVEMAQAASLYDMLWRPNQNCYIYASEITPLLKQQLTHMIDNKEYYSQFNPENGWGSYSDFIYKVNRIYNACLKYPNALIEGDV